MMESLRKIRRMKYLLAWLIVTALIFTGCSLAGTDHKASSEANRELPAVLDQNAGNSLEETDLEAEPSGEEKDKTEIQSEEKEESKTDRGTEVFSEKETEKESETEMESGAEGESETEETAEEENLSDEMGAILEVHYIDVGQADATLLLLRKEDGSVKDSMLIDAGDDSSGTKLQSYLRKQGISTLGTLIVTHFDADHCGGADVMITKFKPQRFICSPQKSDTSVCRDVFDAAEYWGIKAENPKPGNIYAMGDASITILAPAKENYEKINNSSIALLVSYGKNRFLFTGDAEAEEEQEILRTGIDISCDVFQAGHHGSSFSNSLGFLNAAAPKTIVISCGQNNSYGHPSAEVLNRIRQKNMNMYRTDLQGTVIAYSDGNSIVWSDGACTDYTPGEPKEASITEPSTTAAPTTAAPTTAAPTTAAPTTAAPTTAAPTTAAPTTAAPTTAAPTTAAPTTAAPTTAAPTTVPERVEQVVPPAENIAVPTENAQVSAGETGKYVVNNKNGKIHINGACSATGGGKNQMKEPVYFNTYEEAEAYSIQIAPKEQNRNCKNCF